jgi:hypothetical protein
MNQCGLCGGKKPPTIQEDRNVEQVLMFEKLTVQFPNDNRPRTLADYVCSDCVNDIMDKVAAVRATPDRT